MKYIILVGDGMGDFPIPELGGKTPLAAASTPAMDALCRHGELLRLKTIPPGFAPGSDVANLSLLGYRPEKFYSGRAPLEAASMGVNLRGNETACRCNLVTLDSTGGSGTRMVDYSAGHIATEEARELILALNHELGSEKIQFYPGINYRHLLVYRGELGGLESVPPHDHIGEDITEFWERYKAFPDILSIMEKARLILQEHEINHSRVGKGKEPANGIWLWGQGRAPAMRTIEERYGISGSLISAVDLLKGIGVYGGLEIVSVPGATGYLDTNYRGKAEAALEALKTRDFVFVHVEAPDEAGHQGDLASKMQAIEDFDEKIVKVIYDGLRDREKYSDFRLVIAMDHYTPVSTRTHASMPVPIVLFDSRSKTPGSGRDFSEENGSSTKHILENGEIFFSKLLERACSI